MKTPLPGLKSPPPNSLPRRLSTRPCSATPCAASGQRRHPGLPGCIAFVGRSAHACRGSRWPRGLTAPGAAAGHGLLCPHRRSGWQPGGSACRCLSDDKTATVLVAAYASIMGAAALKSFKSHRPHAPCRPLVPDRAAHTRAAADDGGVFGPAARGVRAHRVPRCGRSAALGRAHRGRGRCGLPPGAGV
jgi:hypothetical protein